jgi:hypothetical protein
MNKPLFEAETTDGKQVQFQTVFSRTELDYSNPTYYPDQPGMAHYNDKEVWYAVLGEIGKNCLIGHHKEIKPETLKYIGD